MRIRKYYENHKGFSALISVGNNYPVGLGLYFDRFKGQTKIITEIHIQLTVLTIVLTWDK